MFAKIKDLFGLVKFQANSRLKDGTEIVIEGDLTEGTKVFVVTDEGNIPLPDGTYELEDGKMVTVVDGLISSIEDAMPEEEVVEEPMAEEPEAEVTETEEVTEVNLEEKMVSLEERIAALEAKLSDIEASNESTKQENEQLKEKNEELSKNNSELAEKVDNFEAKLSKMDGAEPIKKKSSSNVTVELNEDVLRKVRAIQKHKGV